MDPRRLLTFREVARQGSFSRAGEALALTQPAVSQQVAALEKQVGVRLLDRGPGGPAPTEAGALLLAHADAVADRLAQAGAQIAELAASERETLRLGAFPSALASIVPAAIVRLRKRDPAIQVEAGEASGEQLGRMVAAGELHVAVCFQDAAAPERRPEGTERHELGREAMLAVMAEDHPLAGRERLALAELAEDTWTAPSRDHLIHRACVQAGFEPRISFVTRDVLAARGLVASGLAVTLMPELLAAGLPGLAMVRLEGPQPYRSLYGLTPSAGARPAALAFLEALEIP
ncbi:MAG TPA: LysR family transcriptional regulator [Solirubrobacteraceae bacterium]|nr:LysR family transcriptional regulator [Solirubrobacteraceae bacterium]